MLQTSHSVKIYCNAMFCLMKTNKSEEQHLSSYLGSVVKKLHAEAIAYKLRDNPPYYLLSWSFGETV